MAADVWLKQDIVNALSAAWVSANETRVLIGGGDPEREALFLAAYRAALTTVALFFGIQSATVTPVTPVTPVPADAPQLEKYSGR